MTLVATVGVIAILIASAPFVNELSVTTLLVLTFAPEALCFT